MKVVKLISSVSGEHVRTNIFQGEEGYTFVNVGSICQTFYEWSDFIDLLKYGSCATENLADVIIENEEEIKHHFFKESGAM
jgi:hypothetical protein